MLHNQQHHTPRPQLGLTPKSLKRRKKLVVKLDTPATGPARSPREHAHIMQYDPHPSVQLLPLPIHMTYHVGDEGASTQTARCRRARTKGTTMAVFVVNAGARDVHDGDPRAIGDVRDDWHDGRASGLTPPTWRSLSHPGLFERLNLVDSCQQLCRLL